MTPTVVVAPAKLTLSLRIVGVRPDGYHRIEAEMVTLDLADELRICARDDRPPGAAPGSTVAVAAAGTGFGVPVGEDNSVLRALALVGRRADVELHKRIPAGGGLGGGSADAAAVLRWAGVDDPTVAAGLGADVPFCVVGGRARVRGIGEVVEPLPFEPRRLTLVLPPFGCATPAVYRAWDELGGPTADGPNDLEPAALRVEPRLARVRDELGDSTGETPVLAGSGSTWFVPGAHPGPGRLVVRTTPASSPAG